MLLTANRLFVFFGLMFSVVLFVGSSSVMVNALHNFAKIGFSFNYYFGRISLFVIIVGLLWLILTGYILLADLAFSIKNQGLGLIVVVILKFCICVLTALGDQFLNNLGSVLLFAGLSIWLVEVAGTMFLVGILFKPYHLLGVSKIQNYLWFLIIALTWLANINLLFLGVAPGVRII